MTYNPEQDPTDPWYIEPLEGLTERLTQELQDNPQPIPKGYRTGVPMVPLGEIKTEPDMFQVRSGYMREDLINRLADELNCNDEDDALLGLWTGKRIVVIEGHHRFAAYEIIQQKQAKKTVKVPIKVVAVSLLVAMGMAVQHNTRSKDAITRAEEMECAWRMVLMQQGSIAEQATASGVSKKQIEKMRKVRTGLIAKDVPTETLSEEGWRASLDRWNIKPISDYCPDEGRKAATELADVIREQTRGRWRNNPDLIAQAIQILSPALPGRLMETDFFWNGLDVQGRMLLAEVDAEKGAETD
jgi:hypothetical protein